MLLVGPKPPGLRVMQIISRRKSTQVEQRMRASVRAVVLTWNCSWKHSESEEITTEEKQSCKGRLSSTKQNDDTKGLGDALGGGVPRAPSFWENDPLVQGLAEFFCKGLDITRFRFFGDTYSLWHFLFVFF